MQKNNTLNYPIEINSSNELKFIDLFAGIGGFRIAFERAGYKCVFSSEIDEHACLVYKENFGENPKCDITELNPINIPDFDILCAGFPCQSFSICGRQKGFYDDTRGTLFFDICRILEVKRPKAFILENVQNLLKHDKGRTIDIMLQSLNQLGYSVNFKILNAKDFGVPQNRERIIIIGNKDGRLFDFNNVKMNPTISMKPYLEKDGDFEYLKPNEYTLINNYKRQDKSGLIFIGYRNKKIRTVGVREGTEHLSRVHKQCNRIYSSEGIHPTIASQEQCGRYWILNDGLVRKLTLNECFRFMGFPQDFKKPGLTSKLYERIGNSICVNMVEALAIEIKNQFFGGENEMDELNPMQFLENIFKESNSINDLTELQLTKEQLSWVSEIVSHEENLKGVFTVLITSLTYKSLYPNQDVRLHQANMDEGYSGRSFDTKYVTPFLKSKQFYGAMKESGWLTRSLEQNIPFNMDFPGKISNKAVKSSFLSILNDIEENGSDPQNYLKAIMKNSVNEKSKKTITLINPIETESKLPINDIINFLHKHFYFKYKSRGASILPVIAIFSIYECMINELKRFNDKYLEKLASHNSCDKSSGSTGDIVVRDKKSNELYEVVEIKFDIPIDFIMIQDAYKKIAGTKIQRYYILSTLQPKQEEIKDIYNLIYEIKKEHGCQVIINGIFPTLKYYLRLIDNTDLYLENYINNLANDSEINYEHKIAWNKIIEL